MPFVSYYQSKHFSQVGSHAHNAWDDCFWLLMLQERENTTHPERDENSQLPNIFDYVHDVNGNCTAFSYLEKEFRLMKPFLLYSAVFAGNMAVSNMCYLEGAVSEFVDDIRSGILSSTQFAHTNSTKQHKSDDETCVQP